MSRSEELLHQQLYRETFRKKAFCDDLLEVRHNLEAARLFVLSDDMVEFLTNQMVDAFAPAYNIKSHARRYRRVSELYDTTRHFSRLPHKITWVEFSMAPYVYVMEDRGRPRDDNSDRIIKFKERQGWMLKQHPQIETAFRGRQFACIEGSPSYYPYELTWDSEENQVPWPSPDLGPMSIEGKDAGRVSVSEAVVEMAGYVRPSMGLIWSGISPLPDTTKARARALTGMGMFARLVWLFLSTVNKIPVIGEQPVVASKGFVARGRYRSFLSHKLLTLNVPRKGSVRKMALHALATLRRAHMVRGHWRDDWHLPPGNKAIWVGEHQRGDASKGFVVHDYKVQHEVNQ